MHWHGTALLISRWFSPGPMKRALVQSTWSPDCSQRLQRHSPGCVCVCGELRGGRRQRAGGQREASPRLVLSLTLLSEFLLTFLLSEFPLTFLVSELPHTLHLSEFPHSLPHSEFLSLSQNSLSRACMCTCARACVCVHTHTRTHTPACRLW